MAGKGGIPMTEQTFKHSFPAERSPVGTGTPRARLCELLAASGGQLPERVLVTELPYSTEACRRVMAELETTDDINRLETDSTTMVRLVANRPRSSERDR